MCNIKQTREPPQYEGRTWTWIEGRRVRIVFTDELRPTEPYIVIERADLQPPPPSRAMMAWINGLRAKYQLGGI